MPGHAFDLFAADRRLYEQHVGTRFAVTLAALARGVQSFDRDRIGARNDHEVTVVACIACRLDLGHHFGGGNHTFAREMSAALRPRLVFDMYAGDACFLIIAYGPARVDGVAV